MQVSRIVAKTKRRFKVTTRSKHNHPVAYNLVRPEKVIFSVSVILNKIFRPLTTIFACRITDKKEAPSGASLCYTHIQKV